MTNRLRFNPSLLLTLWCVLLLAAAGRSQTPVSVAGAQPTGTTSVKRTLPRSDAIKRLELPPDQVTIRLPEAGDASAAEIDPGKIKLKSETVTISSYEELLTQLAENGLAPEPDVLSMLYDLNPAISRLNMVSPGTKLLLPKIEGDTALRRAIKAQRFSSLVSDSTFWQRQTLSDQKRQIEDLSARVERAETWRFGTEANKDSVRRAIETAEASLGVISDNRFSTRRRVLEQTGLEAKALQSLLSEALSAEQGLAAQKIQAIQNISATMAARSADMVSGGSGSASVEVQTVKKSDGSEVKQKRVFYAPKLAPEDHQKYRDPSSPTSEALPLGGEYTFWVGEGDNPTPAISDKVTITVKTKNDPVKLQISGT